MVLVDVIVPTARPICAGPQTEDFTVRKTARRNESQVSTCINRNCREHCPHCSCLRISTPTSPSGPGGDHDPDAGHIEHSHFGASECAQGDGRISPDAYRRPTSGFIRMSDHPRLIQGHQFLGCTDCGGQSLRPDLSILTRPDLRQVRRRITRQAKPIRCPSLPSLEAITSDQRFHLTLVTLNALARAFLASPAERTCSGYRTFPAATGPAVLDRTAGFEGRSLLTYEKRRRYLPRQVAVYPVDVGGLTLQGVASIQPRRAPGARLLGGSTDQFAMDDLARAVGANPSTVPMRWTRPCCTACSGVPTITRWPIPRKP